MPNKVNPKPGVIPEADLRNDRPKTAKQLRRWIRDYTGIKIPHKAVCLDHQSPWECFEAIHLKRPSVALILGSRGSGKSFLSALDTHLTSRWDPDHGTRILGGSKAKSVQIYRALRDIALRREGKKGSDADSIAKLRKDRQPTRMGPRSKSWLLRRPVFEGLTSRVSNSTKSMRWTPTSVSRRWGCVWVVRPIGRRSGPRWMPR